MVLDAIATQLRADGRTDCTSPDLLTCGSTECHGDEACGNFVVTLDSEREHVIELFGMNLNDENMDTHPIPMF